MTIARSVVGLAAEISWKFATSKLICITRTSFWRFFFSLFLILLYRQFAFCLCFSLQHLTEPLKWHQSRMHTGDRKVTESMSNLWLRISQRAFCKMNHVIMLSSSGSYRERDIGDWRCIARRPSTTWPWRWRNHHSAAATTSIHL